MAAKGGSRTGAGRPNGLPNKRTLVKIAEIEASGLTPLDFMLMVMRDESRDLAMRIDAAKAAAPYVHAKLSNVELSGRDGGPLVVQIAGMDAEL